MSGPVTPVRLRLTAVKGGVIRMLADVDYSSDDEHPPWLFKLTALLDSGHAVSLQVVNVSKPAPVEQAVR